MPDVGLTHVALTVADTAVSAGFYGEYAGLRIVHRRPSDPGPGEVLWLADGTRPFVLVLIPGTVRHPLGGSNHLGVACASREDVDAGLDRARGEGRPVLGPFDDGPPVGYWGIVADPDGHQLELSFGQEVGLAVGSG